jgi:glyoxylase-like metal-dependent hydrolase (beta-lactamase superfamily II)
MVETKSQNAAARTIDVRLNIFSRKYNRGGGRSVKRWPTLVLICGSIVAGCERPTPEVQLVRDAATALGGAERVQAVRTVIMEGQGTQYNLGQDLVPGASGQTFTITQYRRAIDVQNGRARTELTRVPNFAYFLGPAPQRQIQGIDGAVGYNVAVNGTASRIGDAAANDRRTELLRHPVAALRIAMDPATRLSNVRTQGGDTLVDVTTFDGRTFTLGVSAATKQPTFVATMANHVNLGDVRLSTTFADYHSVSGLNLPTRLTTKTDDFTTIDVRVTKQSVDADAELAAPAAAASATAPVAAAPTVTVSEVSAGIWQLAGGSHRSVLVEFADRLVLFEAPQNDARALAVIAESRQLRPGKPLTHLVNSHHHFDHSGGVRAAVSEGLTVITHQGNAAFFEDIIKRPHSLVPDALSKNPKPLTLETVGDEKVISDKSMTMHLFVVPGIHTETMLMAYFPRERILVEADLYEADEHIHVFAPGLLEQLKRRNLPINRIVGLHSNVAPFDRLLKDAAAPAHP